MSRGYWAEEPWSDSGWRASVTVAALVAAGVEVRYGSPRHVEPITPIECIDEVHQGQFHECASMSGSTPQIRGRDFVHGG